MSSDVTHQQAPDLRSSVVWEGDILLQSLCLLKRNEIAITQMRTLLTDLNLKRLKR